MPKIYDISPTWDADDIAWLAGLYEGEGSLSQQNSTKHRYWVLGIQMTDEDVVRRAHLIAQCGTFLGPLHPPCFKDKGYKPLFRLSVNSQQHIFMLTSAMLPYLGQRRTEKIQEFRADFEIRFARRGLCRAGLHPMDGRRRCRLCVNAWQRQHRQKLKDAVS